MEPDIKREFERLHREIKSLKATQEKATWVPAEWVIEITGWSIRKLQKARVQGVIQSKQEGARYRYKLESIPEIFIKKQTA